MAEISAKLVKELRDATGAGMMDCKKALKESDGNMENATAWLRQKGLASAAKKSGRVASEGVVESYIHTGARIGVLVEVNCETDFVARREEFQSLARNIAMQIAACPNVEFVSTAEIPAVIAERERAIEIGRDDLGNKPEAIKEKIVQGRIDKRLKELALLDQPYIKDQTITVDELVKQSISLLGENIIVRRFSRFVLGEGADETPAGEPVTAEPVAAEPVAAEPVAAEPVVEAPVTAAPTAEAPVAEPVVEPEVAPAATTEDTAASKAPAKKTTTRKKK